MSHTLSIPLTVTPQGAAQYPNPISNVTFTFPTGTGVTTAAQAIAQVLLQFGSCEALNPNVVNTGNATFS